MSTSPAQQIQFPRQLIIDQPPAEPCIKLVARAEITRGTSLTGFDEGLGRFDV